MKHKKEEHKTIVGRIFDLWRTADVISRIETTSIIMFAAMIYYICGKHDIFEAIIKFAHKYEYLQIDEIIPVFIFMVFALAISLLRRILLIQVSKEQLRNKNEELQQALSEIKQLRGIIPICSYCHKIKSDEKSWQQLDQYINEHTDAEFSHGVCPDCYANMMDGINKKTGRSFVPPLS